MESKIMSLKDAVAKYVKNGDHMVIGGFTTNRKPYALVYEILRQGFTDFVGESGPAGGDWDMLIGAGRVKAYINCYTANSGVTNVSRRFRNWYEARKIKYGRLLTRRYHVNVTRCISRITIFTSSFNDGN